MSVTAVHLHHGLETSAPPRQRKPDSEERRAALLAAQRIRRQFALSRFLVAVRDAARRR